VHSVARAVSLAGLVAGCTASGTAPMAPILAPPEQRECATHVRPQNVELAAVISLREGAYEWVTATTSGTVRRVLVQVGAHVRASDPLFELEMPPPPSVDIARAEVVAAEHQLQRMEALHRMCAPQKDVDEARCSLERARRELTRAGRGPGAPRTRTVVRAGIEGEVIELRVEPGATVEGREFPECTPSGLATLEDAAHMQATSVAPPPKRSALGWPPADGSRVTFRIPQVPGKTFAGRVLAWGAERGLAEIDNPERLLQAGMQGTLSIEWAP
jgi:biotin carboxyl carrier protein